MSSVFVAIATDLISRLAVEPDAGPWSQAFDAERKWTPLLEPGDTSARPLVTVTPRSIEIEPDSRDTSEKLYDVAIYVQQTLTGDDANREAQTDALDLLAEEIGNHLEGFSPSSPSVQVEFDDYRRDIVVYQDKKTTLNLFTSQLTITYRAIY